MTAILLAFAFWVGDCFCLMHEPEVCYHVEAINSETARDGVFYAEVTTEEGLAGHDIRVQLFADEDGRLWIRDGSIIREVTRMEVG